MAPIEANPRTEHPRPCARSATWVKCERRGPMVGAPALGVVQLTLGLEAEPDAQPVQGRLLAVEPELVDLEADLEA